MQKLMNVRKRGDDTPIPLAEGKFWTTDNKTDAQRYLRPRWDSWEPNAGSWFAEVVEKVKKQGHMFHKLPAGHETAEFFASLTDADVEPVIQSYWETLAKKWKAAHESKEKRISKSEYNRRNQRKTNVS